MTFAELALSHLLKRGILLTDALTIIDLAKEDGMLVSMKDRWDNDIEGSPTPLGAMFFLVLDDLAMKYAEENP